MKHVIEDVLKPTYEDSRMALIGEVYSNHDQEEGIFARIQSWDISCKHEQLEPFLNKRVRVTIEVIE